jgi:predicted nucleic acid-binding protein
MLEVAGQGTAAPSLRFTVVIDTNIVVQDALNVARGARSTTARILSSPFIRVVAPREIEEECQRIVRERARKRRLPVDIALNHCKLLLGRVELIDAAESPHLQRARELIGAHSPEDVTFLAIAIESEAAAIVSRDAAAFDRQPVVQRWTLHRLVDSVVTIESGTLSVVVTGGTAAVLTRVLQAIVVAILDAFVNALYAGLQALGALVNGAIEAISRIPAWGWAIVAAVLIGVAVYSASHPEFRERAVEGLATLAAGIRAAGEMLIQIGSAVLGAIHDVLVWLWDLFLPLTTAGVIAAGVLLRRINELLAEAERLRHAVPGI